MLNEMNKSTNGMSLNNAKEVLNKFKSAKDDYEENFLTLVQGNTNSGVDVTESNIRNNSQFIVDLWG